MRMGSLIDDDLNGVSEGGSNPRGPLSPCFVCGLARDPHLPVRWCVQARGDAHRCVRLSVILPGRERCPARDDVVVPGALHCGSCGEDLVV